MEAIRAATSELDRSSLDRLERIAALDTSEGFRYDGYTSVSAFLAHRCGMGVREANRSVFLARALEQMAYSVKLVRTGDLSLSQFEILAHAQSQHPQGFATDETTLAQSVVDLSWTDTKRAVTYWCCLHEEPQDLSDPEPSRIHLSKTFGARGRLDGDLTPEDHNLLETALEPLISEIVNTTPKDQLPTRSILRAMALTELIRRHLASNQSPSDHGNRPQVNVIIPWDTLIGNNDQPAEFTDGTLISAADARRLACDASVCRLLIGPNSEILDLGRSRRTVIRRPMAGPGHPRPPLPLPRLPPARFLVRRPPHPVMGPTREHRPVRHVPPLPKPPHPDSPRRLDHHQPRQRPTRLHPTRHNHPPQRTPIAEDYAPKARRTPS